MCFHRAIASSAPIWQFTGMTPCNAFYRVTSSVYTGTSAECGSTLSASWKAIDDVTKTSKFAWTCVMSLDLNIILK